MEGRVRWILAAPGIGFTVIGALIVEKIGLCPIGLSTIHDAFCRYQVALFKNIYIRLLRTFTFRCLLFFKNEKGKFSKEITLPVK